MVNLIQQWSAHSQHIHSLVKNNNKKNKNSKEHMVDLETSPSLSLGDNQDCPTQIKTCGSVFT